MKLESNCLKGKRLLFLGAIRQLCEAVEYAKSMGIYTIVIDYLPDSPAKKVADKAFLVSTTDVEAVVKLCREEKVDGIFTAFIDSMLPYAREVCDRLNLPFYAAKEHIRMSLDKRYFKSVCKANGVSIARDYKYDPCTKKFDEDVRFPVIVKPVDSSGGRGIKICNNREMLCDAFEYALRVSPGKNVLVEEYVAGDEVTATYTMKDGKIALSCFKDKLISSDHDNITSQSDVLFMPSSHLDLYMEQVHPAVVRMLQTVEAKDGCVFFQGIATKERIVLFECGYRPNGACDYRHIERENGVNYLKSMIAHAVTGKMLGYEPECDNPYFRNYILTYNLWGHGGTVGAMEGLDAVGQIPNVVKAEYMHDVGDKIVENNTLAQRVFRAVIVDDSIERIKTTIQTIQENVQIKNTDGKSMLYKAFDVNRLAARYGGKT